MINELSNYKNQIFNDDNIKKNISNNSKTKLNKAKMAKVNMKHLPKSELPRERLVQSGGASLSNSELLAIIIKQGSISHSALDVAKNLLIKQGSLREIFNASIQKLQTFDGIGKVKAIELLAIAELFKRIANENVYQVKFNSAAKCMRYLSVMLRDYKQEHFACLLLNNQLNFLGYRELFTGNIISASVYTGEVVRIILDYNAVNVVIAHNHPSGDPKPSQEDIHMTQKLKKALSLVDVKLVDHIIVGYSDNVSLAEKNLM